MPVRRRLAALAGLCVLCLAAPASALDPGPDFFRFDDQEPGTPVSQLYPDRNVLFEGTDSECEGTVAEDDTHESRYLAASCAYIAVRFPLEDLKARVSVKVRQRGEVTQSGRELFFRAYGSDGETVLDEVPVPEPDPEGDFTPLTVYAPDCCNEIGSVAVVGERENLDIDDLAVSEGPQPDTEIQSAPNDPTRLTTAEFEVAANAPYEEFQCRLDNPGGRFESCPDPIVFTDLKEGRHTLAVAAVDEYGERDPTPDVHAWHIDVSPPGTVIEKGPPAETEDRTGVFEFTSANEDTVRFQCRVDGAPFGNCTSPASFDVDPGPHEFAVRAVDRAANVDPTPATREWTVVGPAATPTPTPTPTPVPTVFATPTPTPPVPDRDADTILDAVDNCPDAANLDQADEDGDAIGNACEILPSGDIPPVAGTSAVARVVSGEVFVKLPPGTSVGFRSLRPAHVLLQEAGFVPLKGVASVPVGSTIDTQKGSMALQSARNTRPLGDARRKLQTATFAAGIFRLRQARARGRASSRSIPTDIVMATPAGADAVCRQRPRSSNVVRRLSANGKGLFRTVGGASTATAKNATWITSDRCNGTRTEVGRGKVKVRDKRRRKTVTVRAGRAYVAKAPLFRPLKGRPSGLR